MTKNPVNDWFDSVHGGDWSIKSDEVREAAQYVTGTITDTAVVEDIRLPPECRNENPINAEAAAKATKDLCRGQ